MCGLGHLEIDEYIAPQFLTHPAFQFSKQRSDTVRSVDGILLDAHPELNSDIPPFHKLPWLVIANARQKFRWNDQVRHGWKSPQVIELLERGIALDRLVGLHRIHAVQEHGHKPHRRA